MHASVGGKLVLGSTWEITIQKNVPARMRDGTTLMSDVYRPAGDGAYPVLLTRLPYGKDRPRDPTYFDPVKVAGAGYVVVVQDVRGRYASEGEFVPFVNEYEDGYDTVEWAAGLPGSDGRGGVVGPSCFGGSASQGCAHPFGSDCGDAYDTVGWAAGLPGSDGRVGMFGLSYFGKTQWQAAVMRPPSLKSMVPGITWGNHLNGAQMRGGVQEVGIIHYWAQAAIAPNELFRKYSGESEKIGEKLPELVGAIGDILSGGGDDALES